MAENIIPALVSEVEIDRFARNCTNAGEFPAHSKRRSLEIVTFRPAPDEVTVNGVRFVRETT